MPSGEQFSNRKIPSSEDLETISDSGAYDDNFLEDYASPFKDQTTSKITNEEAKGKSTSEEKELTGSTIFDLIKGFFSGDYDISILRPYWPLVWIILIGIILFQDNQEGRLNNLDGLCWLGVKIGIIFLLVVIFNIIIHIGNKRKKK